MLRWSIATVTMGGTLEVKLQAAARAGFRTIEIFENDLTFFSGKPREVRKMAEDLGLEIVGLQPMRDFEGMPGEMRKRNFERALRKFDLMSELGTHMLCICSNVSEDAIGDVDQIAADLAELADLAAQRGFSIGYEAMAWGRHTRDWMQAADLIERANRPNLGVVLDSFHIFARKNPIEPIAKIKPEQIALVQINDAPGLLMDPISLSRHHRCFPGQGDWPVTDFLDYVLATGFNGALSLEIFNDQFRGAPAASIARDGMRSLMNCAEELNARRIKRNEPTLALTHGLPAASPVRGVEFLEFVTGGADAQRLATELEGLGFQRVARHRSKDVDLYRQNEVNIVINREQEGFAHSFYLVHGTSVCALALRFDDPKAALERANALSAPTYYGRIGPGEALIPAVAGVENSLIYFMKDGEASTWDQDFVFIDDPAAKGPLTRIDHLNNVVRRTEFLSWVTFYKSVLGFSEEPQVELVDPYGAFYSRVMRATDGVVRIPLNIADGGSTSVSRFIENFGGGGVQQIALATDDLFSFVERATQAGVEFLTIPDNYYDDLAARFDLDAEVIEHMRKLNILYDRNKTGEFFHIYTRMFEQRFFFEILQRRNYDLFGAANTPVRLAAQAVEQDTAARQRGQLE